MRTLLLIMFLPLIWATKASLWGLRLFFHDIPKWSLVMPTVGATKVAQELSGVPTGQPKPWRPNQAQTATQAPPRAKEIKVRFEIEHENALGKLIRPS